MKSQPVINVLHRNYRLFHPVIPFDFSREKLISLDFTENNQELTEEMFNNTELFTEYIGNKLKHFNAKYGIGGYNELRSLYNRSKIFDAEKPGEEPRRLHLGVDIWGKAGTPVQAFMGGMIHSFAFNNHYGDYGATMILLHQLDGVSFYTLYGHISLKDIDKLVAGQYVNHGQVIAHFGEPEENGHWPPHLHFQVIQDLELNVGDYPGVCKYSERERYLANCPDPDTILQLNRYLEVKTV